jgi:hypothetical protein
MKEPAATAKIGLVLQLERLGVLPITLCRKTFSFMKFLKNP